MVTGWLLPQSYGNFYGNFIGFDASFWDFIQTIVDCWTILFDNDNDILHVFSNQQIYEFSHG